MRILRLTLIGLAIYGVRFARKTTNWNKNLILFNCGIHRCRSSPRIRSTMMCDLWDVTRSALYAHQGNGAKINFAMEKVTESAGKRRHDGHGGHLLNVDHSKSPGANARIKEIEQCVGIYWIGPCLVCGAPPSPSGAGCAIEKYVDGIEVRKKERKCKFLLFSIFIFFVYCSAV